MAKLCLQRMDYFGFADKYRIYLNRSLRAKIGFGQRLELDLAPGRYHLSVGGRRALDQETWFDIDSHNRAFIIETKPISGWKNFPKNRQIHLIEKGPIQLPDQVSIARHKRHYLQVMFMQIGFNLLMLAAVLMLFYYFVAQNYDYSFLVLALIVAVGIFWINHGIRKNLYQRTS